MPYQQGGYWYDDEGRMLVRVLAGGAPLPDGSYKQGGHNFDPDGKLIVLDEGLADLVGNSGSQIFGQAGSAAIGASSRWRAPSAGTLTLARLSCVGAPVGSALTVAVRRNGNTVATLSIAAGSTTDQSVAPALAFVAGDLLDCQATSVGSTTAATGVAVQLDHA